MSQNAESMSSTDNQEDAKVSQPSENDRLKKLQENTTPVPIRVACTNTPRGKPGYLGIEYHGRLSRGEDRTLLDGKCGRFIIRDTYSTSREHEYTIVFNYASEIQTIKLVYDPDNKTFATDPSSGKQYKTVLLLMSDLLSLYRAVEKREAGGIRSRKESFQKSHNFHLHTYLHPKWCDHCNEFLWGIHNQGYRCRDCNTTVHKFCRYIMDKPCEAKFKLGIRMSSLDYSDLDPKHNTGFIKGTIPDFRNKCLYFRDCSQFLSAYNIRDVYIDMSHQLTMCFCANCIGSNVLESDNDVNMNLYAKWTCHVFAKQNDLLNRDVKNWEVAYIPMKPKYLLKMIKEIFEPAVDEQEIDLLIAKDFQHITQDMSKTDYSYKFVNSKTGDYSYAQIVLEVYIKPNSYETVALNLDEISFVGDCNIEKNHFRIRKRKFVYPKSIFIKIFGEDDTDLGEGEHEDRFAE